ncbi:MAG: magnesium/cobalt transporter CorA [Candidatus Zixiibacteriota bacterium]
MGRFIHKVSRKAGLSPGSVVYIGPVRAVNVHIDVMDYDDSRLVERRLSELSECTAYLETPTITWINVDGLHEPAVVEGVGGQLGLHPLHLEDVVNTMGRPKVEDTDEYVFVILKMLYLKADEGELVVEHVGVAFGRDWVVTFQEPGRDVFDAVRHRIRKTEPRNRFMSTDYLAYALLDAVVDSYFAVVEDIGERIERLEDDIADHPTSEGAAAIRDLRKKLILLRKAVYPLREVAGGLERVESGLISDSTRPYLRDLYEHTVQVIDTVEMHREMLSTLLDLYHTGVSNRLNEIMKILTIIATIFIPLGFLAGVYGMNFDREAGRFNMPELGWPYGYLMFWGLAIAVGGGLLWFFRRKRWL